MTIDYVRRQPRAAQAPEPLPEPAPARRTIMRPALIGAVLASCAVPVLAYLGLPGWALATAGVALALSRWFRDLVRFVLAYQAMRVLRAVCVWTARRRGELVGPAGSVSDPAAPWRVWLERD